MATSKTLTPTNVTIQIPAFTDKPDQRVNSNCIDKEADAINALSDQIANKVYRSGIATLNLQAEDWIDWGVLKLAQKSQDISYGYTFTNITAVIVSPVNINSNDAIVTNISYDNSKITRVNVARPAASAGAVKVSWLVIGT